MSKVVISSQPNSKLKQEIIAGSHKFTADAPVEAGGDASAPDPHELLLSSLGACTAMTMQIFANKRDWKLESVKVELQEKRVDDPANPGKQMYKIDRQIEVKGNLTQEQLDGLKAVADKCPIHKLITGSKEISTSLKHA